MTHEELQLFVVSNSSTEFYLHKNDIFNDVRKMINSEHKFE